MTLFLASANLVKIFGDTDIFGQILTTGLGVFSLVTWTIMLGKYMELKRLRAYNLDFERRLGGERSILDLPESYRNRRMRAVPYADLFADAMESYWRTAGIQKEKGGEATRSRLEHAENAIQRAIARQILRYESSMIFLGSIVTGAPFLGLLGTVWGVMVAFSAISGNETVGIQALAPGVSAALLTTIAGLVVAIPSVFGYNFLLGQTKQLITEIENYASALADRIELESK